MEKKFLYYKLIKRFYDIGLLREIYASDKVSICNLANSMYLAIPFETIEDDTPVGVVVSLTGVKNIIKNNDFVYEIANSYVQKNQTKYIVPINDELINVFLPIKQKREMSGCVSSNVDLEFEKKLLKKNGQIES